jgi:hypothetical protein
MNKIVFLLFITLSFSVQSRILYKCTENGKTTYQESECKNNKGIQEAVFIGASDENLENTVSNADSKLVAEIESSTPTHSTKIERDADGRIKRSESAKNDFKAENPCPANGNRSGSCSGYVIDHIKALACGGADAPSNMQWQSVRDAKTKDKWERDGCETSKNKTVAISKVTHDFDIKTNYDRDRSIRFFNSSSSGNSSGYSSSNSSSNSSSYPGSGTVYTGSRGGHYTLSPSGNKNYLPRK